MSAASPVLEYDSARHRAGLLSELRELLRYRDLLALFVSRIVKTRYKRSALGVAWTLLNPLLNMAVLSVAFSTLFGSAQPHYPVYVLAGLLCWNFLGQSTTYAMSCLVWGSGLIKRVYMPRSLFAVASVGNGLLNLGFALVALALVMAASRHPFHATWWFLPIAVLLLSLFTLGLALLLSAVAVFFTDAIDLYQVVLQAWFFLTPVIYPAEILPPGWGAWLELNPMAPLLDLFRAPLMTGELPAAGTLAAAAAWSLGTFLLGSWFFTRKADDLASRI